MHDQLAPGRQIRVLTVINTFSRYVPALDPRFSYRGEDVVRTLETVCMRICLMVADGEQSPEADIQPGTCAFVETRLKGTPDTTLRGVRPDRGGVQSMANLSCRIRSPLAYPGSSFRRSAIKFEKLDMKPRRGSLKKVSAVCEEHSLALMQRPRRLKK